jgi:hypothetical protein
MKHVKDQYYWVSHYVFNKERSRKECKYLLNKIVQRIAWSKMDEVKQINSYNDLALARKKHLLAKVKLDAVINTYTINKLNHQQCNNKTKQDQIFTRVIRYIDEGDNTNKRIDRYVEVKELLTLIPLNDREACIQRYKQLALQSLPYTMPHQATTVPAERVHNTPADPTDSGSIQLSNVMYLLNSDDEDEDGTAIIDNAVQQPLSLQPRHSIKLTEEINGISKYASMEYWPMDDQAHENDSDDESST